MVMLSPMATSTNGPGGGTRSGLPVKQSTVESPLIQHIAGAPSGLSAIFLTTPPGGLTRPSTSSLPQQTMRPSVRTPHWPSMVVNVPGGGSACWLVSAPQHSMVWSGCRPHRQPYPSVMLLNALAGGLRTPPASSPQQVTV
jgi:hypothetical protein